MTTKTLETLIKNAFEALPVGVVVSNATGDVVWANRHAETLIGVPGSADLIGHRLDNLLAEVTERVLLNEEDQDGVTRQLLCLRDGQRVELRHSAMVCGGAVTLALKTQWTQDADKYRLLAKYSSDVTLAVQEGRIVHASVSTKRVLGWEPAELVGRQVAELCHVDDLPAVMQALQELKGNPELDYRVRARMKSGEFLWLEARAVIADEIGRGVIVINARGIAARKKLEDELAAATKRLAELAVTDPLTGIANRRKFDETLNVECRRAKRHSKPLSLLLLDVDKFKNLNDTFGHQVGDEVLKHLAQTVASYGKRGADLAARFGGEEFVLLLPETCLDAAKQLAQDLCAAVRQMPVPAGVGSISVSIGVASTAGHEDELAGDELVRRADASMYAAKRAGRNQVCVQ